MIMKKLFLTVLILITFYGFAEGGVNEKYSYKDFTGMDFSKVDVKEFNNTEIIGSCFSQEEPFTSIFPDKMTGVKFARCNVDNVNIPVGNTLEKCTNKMIKRQNDLEHWVVDKELKPIEPLNKEMYQELKISIDPKDIPVIKRDEPITTQKYGGKE